MRAWSISLLLALTGCSHSSPSEPNVVDQRLAPAVNVTGTWTGRYEETSCFSATCQPCCSMRFKGGPPMRDFALTLTQQGPNVSGQFEERPLESLTELTGVVSGSVGGYELRLRGQLVWVSDSGGYRFTNLLDFDAVVDAGGTAASGRLVLVDKREDATDFMRRVCRIVLLERK